MLIVKCLKFYRNTLKISKKKKKKHPKANNFPIKIIENLKARGTFSFMLKLDYIMYKNKKIK